MWCVLQPPPPSPLSVHAVLVGGAQESLLPAAQKLLHSYPHSVWALALVTSLLHQTEVKDAYKHMTWELGKLHTRPDELVLTCFGCLVESELPVSKIHYPQCKGQMKSLAALQEWLQKTS